ncbi:MAG: S8 family serine peptidase [Acidobacteria bacterium]|nr:S8 family serine peptidase [Acidobacteriota bacterium]
MKLKDLTKMLTAVIIQSIVFSTIAFGQVAAVNTPSGETAASTVPAAKYLIEVSASATDTDSNSQASKRIVDIFAARTGKSAVLIDEYGYARDGVLQAVAQRLNGVGKRVFRVDWNALYSNSPDQAALASEIDRFAAFTASSDSVLYIDDLAGFSTATPMFGMQAAKSLGSAVTSGKLRVLTASSESEYLATTADAKLRTKFERVDAIDSSDGFVGDKLSPDLRELVAGADQDRTVKVILQSDDIDNPQLQAVLNRNGVVIADRIESLNMLVIELPVRVAEEVAAVQSAKHLSLDKQVQLLGHIETTTGVSLVRTQTQTVLNALGVAVNSTYQLDGTGIGVAVVDSGVYEGHRSFYDNVNLLGGDRVTKHMDFTVSSGSNSSTSRDPFGHGSHVAGLIAGGKGQSGELTQYRSMAPNAKIINVRVLGSNGTGTSAGLLQGLDWIYTNRAANNIKVVNMSLGTPAVETWRNDPLCRAVRKLVDAGIVVVAAAGNNGKKCRRAETVRSDPQSGQRPVGHHRWCDQYLWYRFTQRRWHRDIQFAWANTFVLYGCSGQ